MIIFVYLEKKNIWALCFFPPSTSEGGRFMRLLVNGLLSSVWGKLIWLNDFHSNWSEALVEGEGLALRYLRCFFCASLSNVSKSRPSNLLLTGEGSNSPRFESGGTIKETELKKKKKRKTVLHSTFPQPRFHSLNKNTRSNAFRTPTVFIRIACEQI